MYNLDECLNIKVYSPLRTKTLGRKRIKRTNVPILFLSLVNQANKEKRVSIKALLDSGASGTIVSHEAVRTLRVRPQTVTSWRTAAGDFQTTGTCEVSFKAPELSPTAEIKHKAHVFKSKTVSNYDMIIGRDLLTDLGIDVCFSDETIKWPRQHAELPMRPLESQPNSDILVSDPVGIANEADRISKILDAKYKKANLDDISDSVSTLTKEEKRQLKTLLVKYESLFDGTLGKWTGRPYDIKLRPDATPYHARPFPVPRAYEKTLRTEIERLVNIGVLKKVNRSEWAAPSFIIPKKDGTVRFINDFRELNKRIQRLPYPIPKIQDILLKLEGFTYATSLDLNMGYYHIRLSPESTKLCTLIFPWGKYEMTALPMGLCNSPDIFQEKMSELMVGLDYVRTYIDDLLVVTKNSLTDHLDKLDQVLKRLKDAGLKVNAVKSHFCQHELEYLGYWITREGIKPLPGKVAAIKNIAPPKTKTKLRSFIGLINYYRDAWIRRSDILAPLANLTGKTSEWKWTNVEQEAFDTIKRIVAHEVLLSFPQFDKPFEIHTDASKYQLGAVVAQQGKPIAFFSRKLNSAQLNYTTTERELLAIVETLKEFRNILLGQKIVVYTDHKNLTYKVFNTERVMRWRLIIEEYGPELKYVKGHHNVVADTLSRLDLEPSLPSEPDPTVLEIPSNRQLADAFSLDKKDLPDWSNPVSFKLIQREQQADESLLRTARKTSDYSIRAFRGGGKTRQLLCYNDRIVIPRSLQKRIVQWYHEVLCHPGETRTELTISQHFYWPGLRKTVHDVCTSCHICQLTKRTKKKYGKLPMKVEDVLPWEVLCVDMIGPYKIPRKKKKDLELWAVTMIDPATGWFEIASVPGTKRADVVANIVEQTWLNRYPWPQQLVLDRGKEFMAEFSAMMINDYNVKKKPITKRNPQANSVIERVHQTIGNMIRTFRTHSSDDEQDELWKGVLGAVAFAVRATVHTTMRASPMQAVFGRDAIVNVQHHANWAYIKKNKQKLVEINNQRENAKRLPYTYQVGQLVLIKAEQNLKYGSDAYLGPYTVVGVNNNGTVRIDEGKITDTYNIRNITPYVSAHNSHVP